MLVMFNNSVEKLVSAIQCVTDLSTQAARLYDRKHRAVFLPFTRLLVTVLSLKWYINTYVIGLFVY